MRRSNARPPEPPPEDMDSPAKLQLRSNINTRPSIFSRSSSPKYSKFNYIPIIATVIALSVLFYLFFVVPGSRSSIKKKFGIVIDGGSTGTRIHVFEYEIEGDTPTFDFGKGGLTSMRVSPGLSAFAEDPNGAGRSLMELLEFGKGRVPKEHWGGTEIRLMATAGLRLLDSRVQGAILESCRKVLRSSVFRFADNWASVITGSDEGIYAWVVANYALGTLGGDPQHTTGIIELGGASAQVTFVANEPIPPEFSHAVRFGNFTYHLYSHSLLHFGQNVALDSLRESLVSKGPNRGTDSLQKGLLIDPCTPKGYSHDKDSRSLSPGSVAGDKKYPSTLHARGNFSECRSAAMMLLQEGKDKCTYRHCYIGSTFIPKLSGKFLATENFFHTSKFFDLSPKAFLPDLMVAGEQFCREDWSKLKHKYHSLDEEDLLRYCFSSAYIVALLHDSLGIDLNDQRIRFANNVRDIPLDWALGAFILQSTAEYVEHPDWFVKVVSDDSPTLLSLIIISIFLMFTAWSVSKWRKPQLKTIYDLEKGRYIVTRIGR